MGKSESVVHHGLQIRGLALEHVEVALESRTVVQGADCGGRLAEDLGPLEVVVVQGLSLEVAQQQDPEIGAVVDHLCADAGLRGGLGVVILALPVDAEEVAAHVAAAGHVHAVGCRDLDVAVGQAAGQFVELPRPPGQDGDLLEQRVELFVGERRHRFTLGRWHYAHVEYA